MNLSELYAKAEAGDVPSARALGIALLSASHLESEPPEGDPGDAPRKIDVEAFTEARREGYKWLEVAAKAGDAAALYVLGRVTLDGDPEKHSYSKAMRFFKQAASLGNSLAAFQLGKLLLWEVEEARRGDPTKRETALGWLRGAADQGVSEADLVLSRYLSGNGGFAEMDQAEVYRRRAAKAGNKIACHELGALEAMRRGKPAVEEACDLFAQAADGEVSPSDYQIFAEFLVEEPLPTPPRWGADEFLAFEKEEGGRLLRFSESTGDGESTAIRFFQGVVESAESEVVRTEAHFRLANLLQHELKLGETRTTQYHAHLQAAVEGGHPLAMCALAENSLLGQGYPRCLDTARKWFALAPEAGCSVGHLGMCQLLLEPQPGEGEPELEEGIRHVLAGANLGEPLCMLFASCYCRQGLGVEKDLVASLHWAVRGALMDFTPCMREVAIHLGGGWVVPPSRGGQTYWLETASYLGSTDSTHDLGMLGLMGKIPLSGPYEARRRFLEAGTKDNVESCFVMGFLARRGAGQVASLKDSFRWLELAQELGHPEAAATLAEWRAEVARDGAPGKRSSARRAKSRR